ncbi:hypothetical protein J31TS6_57150 [Brevibacillus reuszeri]|uniref:DUF4352 domain-containing protein n=1 Tax=Brevibacillus reuszeri TaxID=54915 RepID=UPI001B259A60|nr:DUF4352 domain-containing protein [Brevibacillus reuszeri]GIO09687.1 hypothetical protein J31TS6_57150 [Brevibacillus reuszeri]
MALTTVINKEIRGLKLWQWCLILLPVIISLIIFPFLRDKVYSKNDVIQFDNYHVSITNVATKKEIEGFLIQQKAKGTFVIVDVNVKNTDNKSQYVGADMFRLVDQDNNEFDASSYHFDESSLNPKFSTKGRITYDIPDGTEKVFLLVKNNFLGIGSGKKVDLEIQKALPR